MSLAPARAREAAVGVGVTDRVENLSAIQEPGCAAAIWRRQLPDGFQTWIDDLSAASLPAARLVLRPEEVGAAVQHLCARTGIADDAKCAWLVADVSTLAACFADIMQAPYLQVRLDVIETNACRRFHIDAIKARLICTYRGTGTQYGTFVDGAEPELVFTVPTGSPMIMRGTQWPETPKSGVLHRSPPIEGTGETRLVLVLDPIFELGTD
ncbi:DUF1826 domain-containing protein [Tateyamaria omphalii]|uniref:DUF1826 domain-containing protein n=1 Tax=Tateyamaria omphalii TaxID=299262 RepID=A0A1P8MS60_9RHOB|nr:DUF1826 domain-containing protein [Tateyamaria omphalii]APX10885.1 hypothetical protein BWR18_03645 [Tateyamaria omphalii]